MPAGYAHYVFGEMVLENLDPYYQDMIHRNKELYHIGIHGPDILFYYKALSSNPIKALGSSMHQKEAYVFFQEAQEKLKAQDNEAALAYIYGFINHFVLDHACHGYIGEMEKELQMTHSEIESELDRQILVDKGLNPLTTCLTRHIHVSDGICETIAPFFHLKPQQIEKSLKDLLFYLSCIRAPGKIKRSFVYLCMKIGGIYDDLHGLLINYEPNVKSQECVPHLIHTMNDQVLLSKKLIESFLEQDLDDIYHHNFE